METLVQKYRLDAQEQQIKQLQGDVAKIKTSLKVLEEDLVESGEFRKVVLNWMHQRDSRSSFSSISSFPASSPGSISPPPLLIAHLEALVARSEKRLSCYGHLMSTSHTYSRSSVYVSKLPTSGTPVASIRSKSDTLPVDRGNSADPFFRSPSSLPTSRSLLAQLMAIISRSEEQLSGQGRLMSTRAKWAISDDVHWKLGSEPVVGHDVELKTVVDLDYPDPGQGVEQTMFMGLIFSDLDLCEKGKVPFDRGKSSLSHRPLIGMRLMFSATWQLWVVHGQPRAPDVAIDPSLEDKTVSKGE
ncbi:hypothetical protein Hdeb2414_s0005g00170621 [Helianthus debilis subsp. tardiflorus]